MAWLAAPIAWPLRWTFNRNFKAAENLLPQDEASEPHPLWALQRLDVAMWTLSVLQPFNAWRGQPCPQTEQFETQLAHAREAIWKQAVALRENPITEQTLLEHPELLRRTLALASLLRLAARREVAISGQARAEAAKRLPELTEIGLQSFGVALGGWKTVTRAASAGDVLSRADLPHFDAWRDYWPLLQRLEWITRDDAALVQILPIEGSARQRVAKQFEDRRDDLRAVKAYLAGASSVPAVDHWWPREFATVSSAR